MVWTLTQPTPGHQERVAGGRSGVFGTAAAVVATSHRVLVAPWLADLTELNPVAQRDALDYLERLRNRSVHPGDQEGGNA
jgi:hypothetical protein